MDRKGIFSFFSLTIRCMKKYVECRKKSLYQGSHHFLAQSMMGLEAHILVGEMAIRIGPQSSQPKISELVVLSCSLHGPLRKNRGSHNSSCRNLQLRCQGKLTQR